jgi:hypothetical protein
MGYFISARINKKRVPGVKRGGGEKYEAQVKKGSPVL